MKIAIVGAIDSPISQNSYGGTEIWTYSLVESLVRRGHKVIIFTCQESQFSGEIVSVVKHADIIDPLTKQVSKTRHTLLSIYEMIEVLKKEENFDIIHICVFSFQYSLPFVKIFRKPIIITVHSPHIKKNDAEFIFRNFPEATYIFVSKNYAERLPRPDKYLVINHGIDIEKFTFSQNGGDFLFWFNRINPEKGGEIAVEIARRSDNKLILAGPIQDVDYFEKMIKFSLNKQIKYLGPLKFSEKIQYYQKAKVLLMPIKWEEPFGLVMVEAMACGTPVIAFRRGSIPEIIKDGETGFICPSGDVDAMVRAVKKIYEMPENEYLKMRQNCRKHVEENFTVEKMIDGYEKVYEEVIEDWKKKNG